MSSVINRYAYSKTASPSACETKPQPCSTCGQLECLCRPRFFAGQVLTADDLNRLDYYIRAKHRLHNRQLHGWGVVNGLEVTCDPCGKGVVVGCGYALSPCGDDIVVSEPVPVDVCALIKACREAERLTQPCTAYQNAQPAGCGEGESEWVLAIRYAETASRGVKPLASGGASAQCGCAGSTTREPRTAPVQCEPTVICEGFELEVYRKPPEELDTCGSGAGSSPLTLTPDSELFNRLLCCLETLLLRAPAFPSTSDSAALYGWMLSLKDFLQRYLSSKSGYNCQLLARLETIVCPPNDLTDTNAGDQIMYTIGLLTLVWMNAVFACWCSALLPPCPQPSPDSRVPIATLDVSDNPCRVLSICNWTHHRKIAVSFPALQYWLDLLPVGTWLRCLLEQSCCTEIVGESAPAEEAAMTRTPVLAEGQSEQKATFNIPPAYQARAYRRLNPQVADPARLRVFGTLLQGMIERRGKALEPRTLIESVFLSDSAKTAEHLSATELANLPQFLLLNQILDPLLVAALGPVLAGKEAAAPESTADVSETAALKEQIASLQSRLDAQEAKLTELSKKRRGTRP